MDGVTACVLDVEGRKEQWLLRRSQVEGEACGLTVALPVARPRAPPQPSPLPSSLADPPLPQPS